MQMNKIAVKYLKAHYGAAKALDHLVYTIKEAIETGSDSVEINNSLPPRIQLVFEGAWYLRAQGLLSLPGRRWMFREWPKTTRNRMEVS